MTKRLPEFVVEEVEGVRVVGRFEASKWVSDGDGVMLLVGERLVEGRFEGVDTQARRARIRINEPADLAQLRVGARYPFVDVYWGDKAALVLDRSTEWRLVEFQPVEAIERVDGDVRILAKATSEDASASVEEGGWDHEHCEICYEKIGAAGLPKGWTSASDEWLCEACYEAYLKPRSLGFIVIE